MSNQWSHGLCDCCSPCGTCMCAWCWPCGLHGKTSDRLEDPALKEGSYCNGNCCFYLLASYCGLNWVLLMLKRQEIRQKFGIEGSTCNDCIVSCCCPCCVLAQHEKELDSQSALLQGGGYQAPAAMAYPPQAPMEYPPPAAQEYPPKN